MLEYVQQNAGAIWAIGALLVGAVSGLCLFVGLWWLSAHKSPTWGMLFGWIPGAVGALVGSIVLGGLWPLTLLACFWLVPIVRDWERDR